MAGFEDVPLLELPGPVASIADPHLVTRGPNDDSCEKGIRWALHEAVQIPDLAAFAVLGDMVDRWLAPWEMVLHAHRHLLTELDRVLAERNALFVPLPGNHDGVSAVEMGARLRLAMPRCRMAPFERVFIHGVLHTHGHEWDRWNRPGPLRVLARAGTAIAGGIEFVLPFFEESWINPSRLSQPGRMENAYRQAALEEAADKVVARHSGLRVMHGHTHRRRQSENRRVACPGSCTHGRGEMAIVWPDGTTNLMEMQGAA